MMGTSTTCHLGSKPSVRKATPTSLAMLFTCALLTALAATHLMLLHLHAKQLSSDALPGSQSIM